MRKGQKAQGSDAWSNALFLGATLFVVLIFAGTFALGTRRQGAKGLTKSVHLKQTGEYLRSQADACHAQTAIDDSKLAKMKGDKAVKYRLSRQLEKENDRLVAANSELEKKHIECVENAELSRATWQQEDRENTAKLDDLDRKNKDLREKAKRLAGTQGMTTILLLAGIKKLGEENARLRAENGMEPADVTDEYVNDLVQKWSKFPEFNRRKGEVLPPNRTEMWGDVSMKRRQAILDHYDPDRHAGKIFLPKRLSDGTWTIPAWNGRYGTQDVRHGTFVDSRLCPITNINRQLRVLYEYALCAVGNNLTQFMYPTAFKRCKECHTEYLHNYIETPLVLFCDDCRPMHNTNEFRLLCQGYSSDEQYGGMLFWRTRSRLRFKARFLNLAEQWMSENRFSGKTLAVRLPHVEQKAFCDKLRNNQRPILSFTKLLKKHESVQQYSDDFELQCNPTIQHAAKKINERVSALGDVKAVYVSTDMGEEDWLELRSKVQAPLHRRLSTGRPTEDDIVDTYISANCDNVIINRFDIKSAHINEARMLLNVGEELRVVGTHVW